MKDHVVEYEPRNRTRLSAAETAEFLADHLKGYARISERQLGDLAPQRAVAHARTLRSKALNLEGALTQYADIFKKYPKLEAVPDLTPDRAAALAKTLRDKPVVPDLTPAGADALAKTLLAKAEHLRDVVKRSAAKH